MSINLLNGNCLDLMETIPDGSIDMILCDLPYGTSASSWDIRLPMDKLWKEYKRIIRENRCIVLFAQQPFTSLLICSNLDWWKYNWVWEKDNATNFLNSHYQPMKITEDICVFGVGSTFPSRGNVNNLFYNPQMEDGKPYTISSGKHKSDGSVHRAGYCVDGYLTVNEGKRYPKNLIKFKRDKDKFHPTQKPVALCEYLIRTYTNEGDVVLDNCMGSGTTGVACVNLNRNFIGMEISKEYFDIASERIKQAKNGSVQLTL